MRFLVLTVAKDQMISTISWPANWALSVSKAVSLWPYLLARRVSVLVQAAEARSRSL